MGELVMSALILMHAVTHISLLLGTLAERPARCQTPNREIPEKLGRTYAAVMGEISIALEADRKHKLHE
jgi:hypothetical protein